MNKTQQNIVANTELSKSAKIRALHAKGMKTGEIAKVLGIRYQFARNVLVKELAKNEANSTEE